MEALNKRKSKTTSEKTEEKHDTLCLPYIHGLSESVERVVRDLKVRTVFKTTLTLRRCLTKVKTPTDPLFRFRFLCFSSCPFMDSMMLVNKVYVKRDMRLLTHQKNGQVELLSMKYLFK